MTEDDWVPRMDTGRVADASGYAFGLWFELRRRTTDGYTRVEMTTTSDPHLAVGGGAYKFTVYLTDNERRKLAAALLEGLT